MRNRSSIGAAANQGTLDQQLAIKWVKKHAKSFGGDPDSVMVFGESAGAASVSVQMASPLASGLMQKAGMESGAFAAWVSQPIESAATSYVRVAKKLGCMKNKKQGGTTKNSDSSANATSAKGRDAKAQADLVDSRLLALAEEVDIDCLLSKPAKEVVLAAPLNINYSPTDAFSARGVPLSVAESNPLHRLSFAFAPTIDGVVLTAHPLDLLQNDPASLNLGTEEDPISVMQGWNANEGTLLSPVFTALGFSSPDNVNSSVTNFLHTQELVHDAASFVGGVAKVFSAIMPKSGDEDENEDEKKGHGKGQKNESFWQDFVSGFAQGWREEHDKVGKSSGSARRLLSPSDDNDALEHLLSNFSLDSLNVDGGNIGTENGGNDNNDGGSEDRSYYWSIIDMLTAAGFSCPTLHSAALLSHVLDNVFVYEFAQPGGFNEGLGGFPQKNRDVKGAKGGKGVFPNSVGVTHGSELPFVFDDEEQAAKVWTEEAYPGIAGTGAWSSDEAEMAKAMNLAWINFAMTGNPNDSGRGTDSDTDLWPSFSSSSSSSSSSVGTVVKINATSPFFFVSQAEQEKQRCVAVGTFVDELAKPASKEAGMLKMVINMKDKGIAAMTSE